MLDNGDVPQTDLSNSESNVQKEIAKLNDALSQFIINGNSTLFDDSKFSDRVSFLAKKLNQLFAQYEELKNFSVDLAKGNLSGNLPQRNNWLAGPLKSLHAQMLHLSWQTKQVADGDYHQVIDFMGEFSEAFNRMVSQLSEREEQLAQGEKAMRTVLENTPTSVVVMGSKMRNILFQSKAAQLLLASNQFDEQDGQLTILQALINFNEKCDDVVNWEFSCPKTPCYLSVRTCQISLFHEAAYLHAIRDITEEKLAEDELRTFAYYDRSTNVGNRNSGLEYLSNWLSNQLPFIVAFIDMDGLKSINDTFGHVAGDSALRELAQVLRSAVRDNDYVFRMGGDEFLIVFHKSSKEIVDRVIERIRSVLLLKNEQLEYDIAFSVGTYIYDGESPMDVEELLQKADSTMYLEKKKKKNAR